ncbi:tRNA (adenine(22)-N(1))-methyltransferase [Acholeplasma equifetale]|uniref:tRNA (adenine(22)-N(1))-methyltransferase n=1 Tax=Acholeplasma equifetale TaxID=264634 RepID=UPI0009FD78AD|nr:class I SAM-dependent methyltransferase [Acholeplasma equifetale]
MNRIEFIAELTKGYDVVLDIGSDHGLVLKYAFDKGYIKKGMASDINPNPLKAAQKTLTGYPVEFYLSNGFESIDKTFDLAIITGMGPHLISEILINRNNPNETYLLGPNQKVYILREFLMQEGFEIIDEYVVYDGFYYCFLKVKKGRMQLTDAEKYIGPKLKTKKEAIPYYEHMVTHYENLIPQLPTKLRKNNIEILNYFKETLNQLKNA